MIPPFPSPAALRRRLGGRDPERIPDGQAPRRAAVSMLFAFAPEPALLLIKRAEHPDDPWSGHVGLPGGKVDPPESDLAAARREAHEELALDLAARAELLGRLDDVRAIGRGRVLGLAIAPFVFGCARRPAVEPDPREVAEAFWVPVSFLRDPRRVETMDYRVEGRSLALPCLHFEGKRIWGLTYRMLRELFARLDGNGEVLP